MIEVSLRWMTCGIDVLQMKSNMFRKRRKEKKTASNAIASYALPVLLHTSHRAPVFFRQPVFSIHHVYPGLFQAAFVCVGRCLLSLLLGGGLFLGFFVDASSLSSVIRIMACSTILTFLYLFRGPCIGLCPSSFLLFHLLGWS